MPTGVGIRCNVGATHGARRPGNLGTVRTIGNILWFVLAGLWLAIGYVIAGLLAFVLIITIPFGIASFRLAGFVLWPFGRTAVWRRDAGAWSVIGNVIWVLLFGWELALAHLLAGLLLMITIIGIPFGIACWKMVPLALLPLGRQVVPVDSVVRDPYAVPYDARQPSHP
jgi:uncharacterized membrane protein YccF (DUF307 family)